MKKSIIILITTFAIVSLFVIGGFTLFSLNINEEKLINNKVLTYNVINEDREFKTTISNLYYGVDTRFAAIKKEDVHNATTIYDFLNEGEKQQISYINSVEIVIIKDNKQSHIRAYGTGAKLNNAQTKILRATDYFSHFTIRTEFKEKNKETGKLEERYFSPHITVAPERQATYVDGKEALIEYLKANSKGNMTVIKGDKLGAIKLSFIITKNGSVTDVKHDAMTTGYPSIDKKFIQLLKNIPGKWTPAENINGEKMDQELVFTFGPANGC